MNPNKQNRTVRSYLFPVLCLLLVFVWLISPLVSQEKTEREGGMGLQETVKEVIQNARPAIVVNGIRAIKPEKERRPSKPVPFISATVISYQEKPYVITSWHGMKSFEKSRTFLAKLSGGQKLKLRRLGYAPHVDLTVLRIRNADEFDELPAIKLADSSEADVGDHVLTTGGANEYWFDNEKLDPDFHLGSIATRHNWRGRGNLLHVDAAVYSGNSGGALINMKGEYLGMTVLSGIRTWSDEDGNNELRWKTQSGLGFCTPSTTIKHFLKKIVEQKGRVLGGKYSGIPGLKLDKKHTGKGAKVKVSGKAPLERGDVILEIDGRDVNSHWRYRDILASYPVDTTLTFVIRRDGQQKKVQMTVQNVRD